MRRPPQAGQFRPVSALNGQTGKTKSRLCGSPNPTYARPPTRTAPVPSAPYSRPRLVVALCAIAKGTPLRVTNLVGEEQNSVDDAPDDGANTARDEPDDQLRNAQSGVAEVNAANADEPEQAEQLEQSRDDLGFVGQRLTRQRMTAKRRGRVRVCRRI